MSSMRLKLTGAVLAAVMALGVVPVVASAQTRVLAYEVMEGLQFKPGKSKNDGRVMARRLAEAALLGNKIDGAVGSFATATNITATATSSVDLVQTSSTFGTGPIKANFDFERYTDLDGNGQRNLSDLVIIASGRLKGTLNLRPALIPDPVTGMASPYAPVSGRWQLDTPGSDDWDEDGVSHPFVGVFLIPFMLPAAIAGQLAGVELYLNPPDFGPGICAAGDDHLIDLTVFGIGMVCPLTLGEHVLGFPLTKAVIVLQ